ncbi:E3 ubiquitin-protein ligase KEG-like isoform X1 [Zingiber officinale]|uniref:Protein kinase domain-containing protein n=2 Tax=Zingiber officinale TaxID=94328 RepID=A0A8J5HJ67_ZINOF|nr:E3 ubiquitin-protein ligase KEG-like isoform X1 [Zingiber officinale]KAG6525926.1 hypothetical protein ZIOFF_015899 [Zingiber officinale]
MVMWSGRKYIFLVYLDKKMSGLAASSEPSESSEYILLERDQYELRPVDISMTAQNNIWIDPSVIKLKHRIGRGPYGDVWIATQHQHSNDYDHYHEVAVKMLYPIKDDQIPICLAKFEELYTKCRGMDTVCHLEGVTIQNGRVCIIMKYYEGSIGDKMARQKGGRISLSHVKRYIVDLARGILKLHGNGILLLNLKPCNFLLDKNDQAVIGDFGIPHGMYGLSLPSSDLIQRLGTPNYMAPEQWEPSINGPISFETDSWGLGCSIVEMLSGVQPWCSRSPDEIYQLVVRRKEKPKIPSGLPPELEGILHGCFEYDFRDRPLVKDILRIFESFPDGDYSESNVGYQTAEKTSRVSFTGWALLKDQLQVGDIVRSRKPRNSCNSESMEIPEGIIVGKESEEHSDGYILVRVHGLHNPLRVHSSTVERVTYGFVVGDWVRTSNEDKKGSPVGILHSIERDGKVTVGFIGIETLWNGHYSELQIAESYCIGQFLKVKSSISTPRFEWPCNPGLEWAIGRISEIRPNGCVVVKFPGRFSFGEANSYFADPSEVEVVNFKKCEGLVKKYQHLEDFHWAVRPLAITFGLLAALKLGTVIIKSTGKSRGKKTGTFVDLSGQVADQQQIEEPNIANPAWVPPLVSNIFFGDGTNATR